MACFCLSKMFRGTISMKFMVVLWLFSLFTVNIQATSSTHWMVTESGLIQPRAESPFELTRPYDLLAFLNQDVRWENIINLYNELSNRHALINKLWNDIINESDLSTVTSKNENCVKSGQLNFYDWYASFLEDGKSRNIPREEYLLYKPAFGHDRDIPDCKKISSLTFSMFAYEHLEGMIQRENLTVNAELTLPELISPIMSLDQFGHWAAVCLRRNSSSWLHYNMASLYWRVRGNARKAMECSRRAVHYAPREYKDIALLNLGSILHRSRMTNDAIIVLGAAVDHNPRYHINHFILATAYAVPGDFNSSLKHFDQCVKLSPGFDLGIKYRHGMLCHIAIQQRVSEIQSLIKNLRKDLIEYHEKEVHWIKSQAAFLGTMKHVKEFDYSNVEKNCQKISELTGLNINELKKGGDRISVIQYFLNGPISLNKKLDQKGVFAIDLFYSIQRHLSDIEKHIEMASDFAGPGFNKMWDINGEIAKEIGPMPVFPDISEVKIKIKSTVFKAPKAEPDFQPDSETNVPTSADEAYVDYFDGHIHYPLTMKINRNLEDFDKDHDWPSVEFCKEAAPEFPENLEAIFPVFLPFENKGIRLKFLLTDQIGVPATEQYELPWYPPVCPQDRDASYFTQKKPVKQQIFNDVVNTGFLRQKLLEYVSENDVELVQTMQDVEIGHRIYTAMHMKLAPNWIIYTLSSLYWRVRGNNGNALHCLLSASRIMHPKYEDIVLTSLASVYLEMGYFDDALEAAERAFQINMYEPATNFVLAELNMLKKHRNTHMYHLKQMIRVESNFMDGLARNLLNGWSCILEHLNTIQHVEYSEGDVCTQVEPGVNMVCEKDGTNCHMTNIQCFSSRERGSSILARIQELQNENLKAPPSVPEEMDDSMFDEFIKNMPLERNALSAHQKNFESMIHSVDTTLKGCGPRGCNDIRPEDLSLKSVDCSYQHLQLGYWLHIINCRQVLVETHPKVPVEISALTPSHKKVPDCKIPLDPTNDFFLERLSMVDSEGWEPMLSLMHQFAEVFDYYDYITLGSKIAKYVDAKPRWWVGLLAAGWWCAAGGRGTCAVRCLAAAHALAPPPYAPHALRALAALLHLQSKPKDAKDVAYLSFYHTPKNKIDAFLVGISHSYLNEYEQAIWMFRYALSFDDKFVPAKACLHVTMCLMLFGDPSKGEKPKA